MTEKTTVTNSSVSESEHSQPGEGKNQEKEIENRIRENLRAEYDRKTQELSEHVASRDEKIEALEAKLGELTAAEQNKLNNLRDEKSKLEEELRVLDTAPEYRAYREHQARRLSEVEDRATQKAMHQLSLKDAEKLITQTAAKESLKADDLRKEVNAILKGGKWGDMLPLERAEMALQERAERKEIEAIREENRRLKADRDGFMEDGRRKPRDRSAEELRDSHISGDMQAGIDRSKALGL